MEGFTGRWKLNNKKCLSQNNVMKAMGRPQWQIKIIDRASEDFRLLHFTKSNDTGEKIHIFQKNVKIFLDLYILKGLSFLFNVPYNKIEYSHVLVANGKDVQHPDDNKKLGACSSRTTWLAEEKVFVIRWYLSNGLLKVRHSLKNAEFRAELHFTDKNGKVSISTKVYDRIPFTEEDISYMKSHDHKQYLND
jgi:hypothetical protein